MCGICGYIDKKQSGRDLTGLIERMNQCLSHRGPDETGVLVKDDIALAMRRLIVIDPETGAQPIFNEDSHLAVVCNGEIYNYQSLRAELKRLGHRFATASDTEAIVHAYEEYGPGFPRKLDGMFAACVLDIKNRSLCLVRDRAGVKPLYYCDTPDFFVFSSEIRPFFKIDAIPRELNPKAVDQFLTLEYTLPPETMIKGIYQLPPAGLLTFDENKTTISSYWQLSPAPITNAGRGQQDVREALTQAVQSHLVSDVPLGAFLSGGIDSSIIVGLMSQITAQPVKTFSIGFADAGYNELDYARIVADTFHTDHHETVLEASSPDLIQTVLAGLDEPLADTSLIPTYLISQTAAKEVKVVLSGDGGDELFGGYDTYMAQIAAQYTYDYLPGPLRTFFLPMLANVIRPTQKKKGIINTIKRFLEGGRYAKHLNHYRWMMYLRDTEKRRLYAKDFQSHLQSGVSEELHKIIEAFRPWDAINQMMLTDFHLYLPQDILTKVDRMSMANSLEVRVPFLDHGVVETAYRIPGAEKISTASRKTVLKQAFSDILPPEILNRSKQGFSMPIKNRLRDALKPFMLEILNPGDITKMGFFQPAYIADKIRQHVNGSHNHAHLLWALIVLMAWWKQHLDGHSP